MIRQFQNAPVHFVILSAILTIAITTVLTAVLSFHHINKINKDISTLSTNAQKLQEGAGEMKYIVVNTQRLAIIAMLSRNQETLLKAPVQSNSFYDLVDDMKRLAGEGDTELVRRMEEIKNGYRNFLFNVIGLASQYVERIETKENALEQVNYQAQQFLHELNLVTEEISNLSKGQVRQVADYSKTIRWINIGSMGAILAAILVAFFFVENKLFRPLAALMKFVREIPDSSAGLSKRICSCSNDEIGELGKSINFMLDNLEKTTVSIDELKTEVAQRIQAEAALKCVKDALESEVSHRTGELQASYEELKTEVLERKQAEKKSAQLQAQLVGTQKMDAIGRLAGGLAHDFNNILTGIIMSSELAAMSVSKNSPIHRKLCDIQDFGERGAVLTRQLLTFSRQQVVKPVVLDINRMVEGMLKMLHRLIGENIRLSFQKGTDLGRIRADPGQFEQILMNLVVNAKDAMPKGGEIHIETCMMHLTNEPILISEGIDSGHFVQLSVADTGHGMDSDTRDRIFEPFFTTKAVGKGTGLGLSTVYGIVKNCCGAIDIDTELHKGTRIKVLFPMTIEEVICGDPGSPPVSMERNCNSSCLKIMLVEDEEMVRESTRDILRKLGHTVVSFADPLEAEMHFHANPEGFDLLLSDVIMPGYDGPELYSRLLPWSPLLKVLFISGYAHHHIPKKLATSDKTIFLQKPFTLKQLEKSIHQLMEASESEKGSEMVFSDDIRMAV